jgi:hypothetical protein
MKSKLLVLAGVATFSLFTTSAFAAEVVGISTAVGNTLHHAGIPGETLITDFNTSNGTTINDLAAGFTFTQDSGSYIRDGSLGVTAVTAPPPEDNGGPVGSWYETVSGGGAATLTSLVGLRQFSFYMGSPDDYNHLALTFTGGGGTQTLNGTQIWGGAPPPGDGNQALGFTVTYTFAPDAVNMIHFTSDSNAFEFDTLGGIAVPEPTSWALMLVGFGLAGGMLRARRRKAALA